MVNSNNFELVISNLPGLADVSLPIAATRSGATGLVNLEYLNEITQVKDLIHQASSLCPDGICLKVALSQDFPLDLFPSGIELLIISGCDVDGLSEFIQGIRSKAKKILVEVSSLPQARIAEKLKIDGLVAKGNEAGGWTGEETSFILLQRLIGATDMPVFAYGGVGVHSIAACCAAGAHGAILDAQLGLVRESEVPLRIESLLERFQGDETEVLGTDLCEGRLFRTIRLAHGAKHEMFSADTKNNDNVLSQWQMWIEHRVSWTGGDEALLPLGQDAVHAKLFAERFQTVSGVISGLRASLRNHIELVKTQSPLRSGSDLANSHGTEFPVVQGPMTRVSDVTGFADAVSTGGGLPFLALALLRKEQIEPLLLETKKRLGDRPWGVGILGFVPLSLRQEQLEVIKKIRPKFALIAGGRPDQAAKLDEQGIASYLHVPSARLLELFIDSGSRRFVFEGRECGGHVGPMSSFILWEAAIETILKAVERGVAPQEIHVLFAGGINDALSGAMLSAITAPLVEIGVKIGALMGTAYLFSNEAVEYGAIVPGFQQAALSCDHTIVLESGPGYLTRCADTEFATVFKAAKRKLLEQGKAPEEILQALEDLNIGRLRIASKGVSRNNVSNGENKYVSVNQETQRLDGMYMMGQSAALHKETTTIRALHEYVCNGSCELLKKLKSSPTLRQSSTSKTEDPFDVAIIGMGCLLPKAQSAQIFWHNLLNKVDAITQIPTERFDINRYFDEDKAARDKIYVNWGGFLDAIDFDPLRYGIPPKVMSSIDPFQLLCLEVVKQALADSGYLNYPFPNDRTGVILGASGGLGDLGMQYGFRAELPRFIDGPVSQIMTQLPEWSEDSFAGILLNVCAGRVANRFDLGGVNFTVDAACASSLAAVNLAARELCQGSADVMIAGGVDTVQSPFGYLCFSKTQAFSPVGRCKTFDQSADGTIISEGLVTLILKRLADAERDGDRIYAVIKSVAGSSDGRDKSLTAPRPLGQKRALERAYAQAGISPASVGLVEAHGTGTVVGDSAELQALTDVYKADGASARGCALGSVKSAIGHTKAAAGVAGLLKTALALHHKVIPPTLHVHDPIAALQEKESPFFVTGEPMPWIRRASGEPRRAAVSAFGFGGTNFHAVLEEYTGDFTNPLSKAARQIWDSELLTWRANSSEELQKMLSSFRKQMSDASSPNLGQLAESLWRGIKNSGDHRLAIVATDIQDLVQKLDQVLGNISQQGNGIQNPRGTYLNRQRKYEGTVAFLFSGQGSQYPYMCRNLILNFAELRLALEKADSQLSVHTNKPLSSFIIPSSLIAQGEDKRLMKALTDTAIAQPALGALGIGLIKLLSNLNLNADMVVGHSYGEYLALHYAGVLSQGDLLRISARRGQLIKDCATQDPGGMVAVLADPVATATAIEGLKGVWLANFNGPKQTIIAGSRDGLQAASEQLTSNNLTFRKVPVACAFHSPLVQGAAAKLGQDIQQLALSSPKIDVFSNSTGIPYPDEPEQIKEILSTHITTPVRFMQDIESMYNAGARWFVEVGPKSVLSSLAASILKPHDTTVLCLDDASKDTLSHFQNVLGQLWSEGIDLNIDRLYRGRKDSLGDAAYSENKASTNSVNFKVDGGRAWKADQTPPVKKPVSLFAAAQPQPHAQQHNGGLMNDSNGSAGSNPRQTPDTDSETDYVRKNEDGHSAMPMTQKEGIDSVMSDYQRLMHRFLETQQDIMMRYLSTNMQSEADEHLQSIAPFDPKQPVIDSTLENNREIDDALIPADPPAPNSTLAEPDDSAAENSTQVDHADDLYKLISERTGYPSDVLDPGLDLEADLGIDSIKKVEILSAFRQSRATADQSTVAELMEELTSAKTLREIEVILGNMSTDNLPSEASQSPADQNSAQHDLIELVSERTGYPQDMLDMNLAIEGDLGIDSIKRVEILGAYQKSRGKEEQHAIQDLMDMLTAAKTLGEITELLQGAQGSQDGVCPAQAQSLPGDVSTSISQASPVDDKADVTTPTSYVFRPIDAPISEQIDANYDGQTWLVSDDGNGIASAICKRISESGGTAIILQHGERINGQRFVKVDENAYALDLTTQESVRAAISDIQDKFGVICGILHLIPLRTVPCLDSMDLDEWRLNVSLDVKCLYHLTSTIYQELRDNSGQVIAVTACGNLGVLPVTESHNPSHGGVIGYMRTLRAESPELHCKLIDFEADSPGAELMVEKIWQELSTVDEHQQILYEKERRLSIECVQDDLNPVQDTTTLDQSIERPTSKWVFLLTGGARGITAEIAANLAHAYRPTLILVGRTTQPPPEESLLTAGITEPRELKSALMSSINVGEAKSKVAAVEESYNQLMREREIRSTLNTISSSGATVHYHQVDVRDPRQFGDFLNQVYDTHGRLDGVIHGAGVIEDKLLEDKVPESFDRVLHTKTDSSFILLKGLRFESLKSLIFMSSVTAAFGNQGQIDYGAANGIINTLALWLQAKAGTRVVALNWAPWDKVGMVSAGVREQFLDRGIHLISPSAGCRVVQTEIECEKAKDAVIVVGDGPWANQDISAAYPQTHAVDTAISTGI